MITWNLSETESQQLLELLDLAVKHPNGGLRVAQVALPLVGSLMAAAQPDVKEEK